MQQNEHLQRLLNIRYPVIQAPMLGITTPEMVAAISNAGGLGSLPVGGLSPEVILRLIRDTKKLTDQPFAVNLFVYELPEADENAIGEMAGWLRRFGAEHGFSCDDPVNAFSSVSYNDQLDVLLAENIPVVSFTFGMPDRQFVNRLKQNNTVLIGTATCTAEAILLANNDTDLVVAQGIEAGGHRGSFLAGTSVPQIGLVSLVPAITDAINIPVIAAGGISDGRSAKAAFALGAAGIQVGSAFIACTESAAGGAHKKALRQSTDLDTVLTNAFTGRWARGLNNLFISAVENSGIQIPPYPYQMMLANPIRLAAQQKGFTEFLPVWAGQSANKAQELPAAEIFKKLVAETGLNT